MKRIEPLKSTASTMLTYTIIFCVLMTGIFALFIIQGRSFVNASDAYDQGYFWAAEMGNNLKSLFSGDGYPLWSWDRGQGIDLKIPIDLFQIISAFFPAGKIELGYTVAIILRLYFSGITFLLFAKEVEMDNYKALMGALCYVTSSFTINLALVQGHAVNIIVLFPLLLLSVDRIYKGRSPLLFIIIVGLSVGVNYYLAYMAAIGVILYILVRYFHYSSEFVFKDYSASIMKFVMYGIAGIMLSAVYVYVPIKTLSGASTGRGPDLSLLYGSSHYLAYLGRLLSGGYYFGYRYVGISILALLIFPVFKGKPSIKATHTVMAFIMLAMSMIPFFGSMLNGFGYVSNRWYFMLVFFLIWCAMEHLDPDELSKTKNIVIMLVWWTVLLVTSLGFPFLDLTSNISKQTAFFMIISLAAALIMIAFIAWSGRTGKSLRFRQTVLLIAVVITLSVSWTGSFYGKINDRFFKYGEINKQLEKSTQRVGSLIKDEGFYRIDQNDWINIHLRADQPANENLWWGNNTIYMYDSKLPSRLSLFNKMVGNNHGYSKRVYMQSNGNRMGLDFLYGVKYYLGDDKKYEKLGADAFAGYAFDYFDNLDGVNIFKSRYDSSLGFLYDKYIKESEFEKLSRLEREQALLQAIVVPDEEEIEMDETMEIKSTDIETAIENVAYEIKSSDGIRFEDNAFVAEKGEATITLEIKGVKNSQLMLSVDNLRRLNKNGKNVGDFKLICKSSKLRAEANYIKNNQTIPGVVDYDLNLGYYDEYSGELTVLFSKSGRYEYDRMYISAMSAELFDKYAKKRSESVFKVDNQETYKVSGSIDAKTDGYMFLSIPINANWNVFVDGGQVAEIHNANIAFFATPVTKGSHTVELRYDYTNHIIALAITLCGIVLTIILSLLNRRSRRTSIETTENL